MSKLSLTSTAQPGGTDLMSYIARWLALCATGLLCFWLGSLSPWHTDNLAAGMSHTAVLTLAILSVTTWLVAVILAIYRHKLQTQLRAELVETDQLLDSAQKLAARIQRFKPKIDSQKT